jgi:hypothetical protein
VTETGQHNYFLTEPAFFFDCLSDIFRSTCPEEATGALDGLRSRQLQDRACQTTVGKSKFIENREVVCLYDRNQAA